ncbi:hypothetical protein [Saccharopolyspora sp. 6V]|uniref:hypothetical protein n=1 Tax=Saccharopolyspora sp. 6V TaxID=2877239 RepID=UPI001CD34345|nr:hypothetical protein [Saccharopolyspora sp. 6V]MCA1194168.1 hypothetical protein [Saccharopolyspora sp. 6V]
MTTNPAEDYTTMGELLHLPVPGIHRSGQVEPTEPRNTEEDEGTAAAGTDLARDRERGVVPAALAGRAAAVRDHLREHGRAYAANGGRFVARHGVFAVGGAWDVATSAYSRWTGRDIEAEIRAAQEAGDHGTAAQLRQQRTENKKLLLQRLEVWGKFLMRVPAALGGLAVFSLAATLLASVVAFARPGGLGFADVWDGFFSFLVGGFEWTVWAATVAVPALLLVTGAGLLLQGYHARRARNDAPQWLMSTQTIGDSGPEVMVTADGIVRALKKLGIPALNSAFKEGWLPQFDLTPTREGQGRFKGYRARFSLPEGVPAEHVADKRMVLAHNLHRAEIEVWPTDYGQVKGGRRGYIDLYVADAGVMEQPTPEYPLLHSGFADVFAGVPVGINQRGEELTFPLVGANVGVGGQPGQGKSNLMRVVVAGAALDPLAELRMHVFAGNGDFDAYEPRLSRYEKGADFGHAESAVEHLHELYAEIERREDRLAELGAKKLSRALAEKHPDLRPLIVGFSECHEMFQAEGATEYEDDKGNIRQQTRKLGKEAAELATQVVKRGRKTGVVALFDTQSSRASAIPTALVELLGINACFYVKSWRNNDGFLGDGSFAAGIRATDLRFNVDRGTCVATGISEELFEILRTYFMEVDDDRGWDAATEIIERAMQAVDPATPVNGTRPDATDDQPRDLMADLHTVLGDEPVSAAEAAKALLAQYGRAYHRDGKPLTGSGLVAELAEAGLKVPSTGNRYLLDPATVRKHAARGGQTGTED